MTQPQIPDLKKIERKAWTSVFQDGLYDLWLGLLLLWWGIIYLLARTGLSTPAMTIINLSGFTLSYLLLCQAKRKITLPRIGRVQFGKKRRSKLVLTGLIAFILVNSVFILTLLAQSRDQSLLEKSPSPFLSPALLAAFFLLLFGLPAYLLEYDRLFVIAVMFAAPELIRAFFREYWGIQLGFFARAVPAVLIILMGLVVFLRFLRDHPVPQKSESGL